MNELTDGTDPAGASPRAPRAGRRLAAVSAGAAITALGLYVVTVGTRTGQLIGELILGGRPATIETLAGAEQVLGTLSRSSLVIGTVVVCAVAIAQRRPRLALAALVVVIGANLTTQVLKEVVLDRADLVEGLFYPLPNSFPSGHATAAASIAVAFIIVLPPLFRAPAVVLGAIVVAVIGVSTLVAGWHRMADAVGGSFVATAWGAGLAGILVWRYGVEVVGTRTAEFGRLSSIVPVLIGLGIAIVGAAGYVLAAADPFEVLLVLAERRGSPALFGVGVLITVGATLLSLGSLGFALRDIRLDPRSKRARAATVRR